MADCLLELFGLPPTSDHQAYLEWTGRFGRALADLPTSLEAYNAARAMAEAMIHSQGQAILYADLNYCTMALYNLGQKELKTRAFGRRCEEGI